MRKREERAKRIGQLLLEMSLSASLRESSYGWLPALAKELGASEATVSRDLALCRRINEQFVRMFGRQFTPGKDQVVWLWDRSHYGFRTSESRNAGYDQRPVGQFPFSTREAGYGEEAFCGLNPSSWLDKVEVPINMDLFSVFRSLLSK